ncbi:hypothetical protein Mnod_7967 (plasmid) [Methylobacterium nodulans ORS 2060]|uniref:Uncharacterized protein n=1 Tax=Methylobacterium nodulans (strain LMG 21967 / CNCM I-2342 / ORS 2060) TaxID=460265 RepID=B8IWS8_METNO|nr:hypothetical protein Mnod_7967 [Methylobacterium nodulans ORS 2060]
MSNGEHRSRRRRLVAVIVGFLVALFLTAAVLLIWVK